MNRNALAAALVAGLVLLAGCSSGLTGSPDGTATEESALDGGTTAEAIEGETGTVNMYVSDEQNAIEDFEHLNVTITRVGVKPAGEDGDDGSDADDGRDADGDGDADDGSDDDTETDGNETADDANATESGETGNENATETPDAEDGPDDEEAEATDDSDDEGTEATDDSDDEETEATDDSDDEETEAADDSDEADGEWREYEVDNRTVDLTELKGANATKLSSLDVPNGSYETVFVYVSDVDGTLNDGSDQRVKLPSGKLQLNSEFTVGDDEEVDFVFDITAVKAGNSGKYVLKPVISESGTDVEFDDVDEREDEDDDEREEERGADERDEDRSSELNASFDGNVTAGENATLSVTSGGKPMENATVFVGGERAGTADANGTYVVQLPDDAEELEAEVSRRGAEAELEVELGGESDGGDDKDEDEDDTAEETGATNESQQRLTVG